MSDIQIDENNKNIVFISAQLGHDKKADRVLGSIESQTRQSLDNIMAALGSIGLVREHVALCRIYIINEADYNVVNEVYHTYFQGVRVPPKTVVGAAFLPRIDDTKILVSVEAVAIKG